MKDMFDLQWKLNETTLNNIGVDYAAANTDPELKAVWIENYRKALSAELAELIREVREHGMGSKNGKIEVVDMLHFLLSLSHLTSIEPAQVVLDRTDGTSLADCAVKTFLALDDLQNSVKWKWWAKGGGFRDHLAKTAVLELWECFAELCTLFSMDLPTVKRIYIAKNEVNFRRQEQNYNEETKTEDDNVNLSV
jgi:dimeric dUTPase (all-alpha-NTP-PPase superfamily)